MPIQICIHENDPIVLKIVAALKENNLDISTLDNYEDPYILTTLEYNQLPAKYRANIQGYYLGFIVGIGWRRIILQKR